MQLKITDKSVRKNVEMFLHLIQRAVQLHADSMAREKEKSFAALIHRVSGEILFDLTEPAIQELKEKEWKKVEINYSYDSKEERVFFEMTDIEQKREGFRYSDLTPQAYRIVKETMGTLNEISQKLKGPSDFKTKMKVISCIQLTNETEPSGRNVVVAAWHHVDREGAETLLLDKPVGTYLFRKDNYAVILEKQLLEELQKPVMCLTLTFIQPKKKITDVTLVHLGQGWIIYNDDPSLGGTSYIELPELLKTFKSKLKYPLYH
jgi:hypothetical protein